MKSSTEPIARPTDMLAELMLTKPSCHLTKPADVKRRPVTLPVTLTCYARSRAPSNSCRLQDPRRRTLGVTTKPLMPRTRATRR